MILLLEPNDPRWIDLVERHPEAMIFHHPAWMQTISDCYHYPAFVAAVEGPDGRLVAGLPLMDASNPLRGKHWTALPFTDFCAPLACSPTALTSLVEGVLERSKQAGVPTVEIRADLQGGPGGYPVTDFVTHQLDLSCGQDLLLRALNKGHRQSLRAAQDSRLQVIQGNSLDLMEQYYRLHVLTRRRLGVPVQPWAFFESLYRRLLDPGLGIVLLAQEGSETVAGSVFLHWQKTLTWKYSALKPNRLKDNPNHLILWHAICWGQENGFDHLDMGRTDLDAKGLRYYKSGWGAKELPAVYTVYASRPPVKGSGRAMKFVHAVISHSPAFICRISGQLLYKYFG